jgi:hypothetical protein
MRFILLLLPMILLQGCQYDPHAHLYTTNKPSKADVVGCYSLSNQTITDEGLSALKGKSCTIELRNDDTFIVTRVPPDIHGPPDSNIFSNLVSCTGTWRIDFTGIGKNVSYWGVYFDSSSDSIHSAHLTGEQSPYGLIFTLGDPDSGQSMIFERDND